jgi:preprotein translocase subunit SecD
MKITKIFTNWRFYILLVFLLLSLFFIGFKFDTNGVSIISVMQNSSAFNAGMISPSPTTPPIDYEVIKEINGQKISDIDDFYELTSNLSVNDSLLIVTDKDVYDVNLIQKTTTEFVNVTVNETVLDIDDLISGNETIDDLNLTQEEIANRTKIVTKTIQEERVKYLDEFVPLGLAVSNVPSNNIRQGLELVGGTRVILSPEKEIAVTNENISLIIDILSARLDAYGLKNIEIKKVDDLSGEKYIMIEIAGATVSEVKDLVASQGKFEAKLGNQTVFSGGQDISFVGRSGSSAGYEPGGCPVQVDDGVSCRFSFQVMLTANAADKFYKAAQKLETINDGSGEGRLSKPLDLYLDDNLVDSLQVSSVFKTKPITQVQISGSGFGRDTQEAKNDALYNMKQLQTVLITGSLPFKLEIISFDEISPILGPEFLKNALLIAIIALISVAATIAIRFKNPQISILVIFTMISEVILTLGVASLFKWNMDIAAIAGIIIAIGSGVDDQIIMSDEVSRSENKSKYSLKQKMKDAFFIIFSSYFTTLVAMVPLLFAGAGILKGFAFTSIVGVTVGVFLTRPFYGEALKIITRDEE